MKKLTADERLDLFHTVGDIRTDQKDDRPWIPNKEQNRRENSKHDS